MSVFNLLERWSELEPDRCSYAAGIFSLRGWTIAYTTDLSERLTISEIQNAVQEAIENRDWNWFVGRFIIDDGIYYKAHISIPTASLQLNKSLPTKVSIHSVAHALLHAYTETLHLLTDRPFVNLEGTLSPPQFVLASAVEE